MGITVDDLIFFLATHGFDAHPYKSYVSIKFSNGKEAYLTPNGAESKLTDLWMSQPTESSGPFKVLHEVVP